MPEGRFDDIVRGATEVFTAQGYGRTQMAGVADAVGVSKGTLYLYVESKDALLWLCLKHADDPERLAIPEVLPVATPSKAAIVRDVTSRIEEVARFPVLSRALKKARAADIEEELRAVLFELYTLLEENCRTVRMLERCSDHPQLGPLWHDAVRAPGRGDFARYVAKRIKAGQLHAAPNPALAARVALETVATWAMHIKWDLNPEPYEPVSTKNDVIDQICRGLLP